MTTIGSKKTVEQIDDQCGDVGVDPQKFWAWVETSSNDLVLTDAEIARIIDVLRRQ